MPVQYEYLSMFPLESNLIFKELLYLEIEIRLYTEEGITETSVYFPVLNTDTEHRIKRAS